MELSKGDTTIQEDMYYSARRQNTTTGTTRDHKLRLTPNIPGVYRIWAVNSEQKEIPKLDTKDDVVKVYPKLFSGLKT